MIKESVELYLFNVAIIFILVLISFWPLYKGAWVRNNRYSHNNTAFYAVNIILLLLFVIFQFTETDFWNYMQMFLHKEEMVEPVQEYIKNNFDNYYVWRAFVWGGAFLIYTLVIKRLGLDLRFYFPLFVLCCLSRFISREQLGIAIMFLGSTFIIRPSKVKVLSYLLGTLLIIGSYYFHNSMIVSIAMLLPAVIRVNKIRAIVVLALFIPLISLFTFVLEDESLMSVFEDSSTNMMDRVSIYTLQVTDKMNFNGLVRQLIFWSPMILMLWDVIVRSSHKNSTVALPSHISYYLSYWYYMFVVSFVFYWVSTSSFISVRFLDKSLFPMVIVLTYWYAIQKPNKTMKISLVLFLLYLAFSYSLTIYKAS